MASAALEERRVGYERTMWGKLGLAAQPTGLTYIIQSYSYQASWDCYVEKRCWCCRSGDCGHRVRMRCRLAMKGWDK